MQDPDSLIFDLDGTLWDAVQTYSDAWNLYFERNSIEQETSKEVLNGLMGMEEAEFFASHEFYKLISIDQHL